MKRARSPSDGGENARDKASKKAKGEGGELGARASSTSAPAAGARIGLKETANDITAAIEEGKALRAEIASQHAQFRKNGWSDDDLVALDEDRLDMVATIKKKGEAGKDTGSKKLWPKKKKAKSKLVETAVATEEQEADTTLVGAKTADAEQAPVLGEGTPAAAEPKASTLSSVDTTPAHGEAVEDEDDEMLDAALMEPENGSGGEFGNGKAGGRSLPETMVALELPAFSAEVPLPDKKPEKTKSKKTKSKKFCEKNLFDETGCKDTDCVFVHDQPSAKVVAFEWFQARLAKGTIPTQTQAWVAEVESEVQQLQATAAAATAVKRQQRAGEREKRAKERLPKG